MGKDRCNRDDPWIRSDMAKDRRHDSSPVGRRRISWNREQDVCFHHARWVESQRDVRHLHRAAQREACSDQQRERESNLNGQQSRTASSIDRAGSAACHSQGRGQIGPGPDEGVPNADEHDDHRTRYDRGEKYSAVDAEVRLASRYRRPERSLHRLGDRPDGDLRQSDPCRASDQAEDDGFDKKLTDEPSPSRT